MTPKALSETEIKRIVQNEIKTCFEQLAGDIRDIKQALLGSDYQKGGLVAMVSRHENYIDRSETLKIIDRAEPAIEWYESWKREGIFERIEELLDKYGKWKWFVGLIAGGSLAGMVSAIVAIIQVIKQLPF